MISVEVEGMGDEPPLPGDQARSLVTAVYADHATDSASTTIIFTGDEHLRELKKTFFDSDVYTDVIAFSLNDPGDDLEAEIYISVDRARENAQTYGESFQGELRRLVVHGALHLMGHDDNTEQLQSEMRKLEDRFLESVPFAT